MNDDPVQPAKKSGKSFIRKIEAECLAVHRYVHRGLADRFADAVVVGETQLLTPGQRRAGPERTPV